MPTRVPVENFDDDIEDPDGDVEASTLLWQVVFVTATALTAVFVYWATGNGYAAAGAVSGLLAIYVVAHIVMLQISNAIAARDTAFLQIMSMLEDNKNLEPEDP